MQNMIALYKELVALDVDAIIQKALEETKDDIAEENRRRMLEGIKADGSEMPHYSYISQTVYGYPDVRIRLRDTGAFQGALHVTIEKGRVLTDSSDEKSEMLKERYGEEIIGLSADTKVGKKADYFRFEYIDDSLRPAVNLEISRRTGLKFTKR